MGSVTPEAKAIVICANNACSTLKSNPSTNDILHLTVRLMKYCDKKYHDETTHFRKTVVLETIMSKIKESQVSSEQMAALEQYTRLLLPGIMEMFVHISTSNKNRLCRVVYRFSKKRKVSK